ncbi:MAG: glucose-6-phosphate dehydrogenase [Acidimicrobiia bacterium]
MTRASPAPTASPGKRADAVVLFGVTGDLAFKRLLPALFHLEERGLLGIPVVGVARRALEHEELRERARQAVTASARPGKGDAAPDGFPARLRYVGGDYRDHSTYEHLAETLGQVRRPLFYLAVPPSLFEDVVAGLAAVGLADGGRVVVEKPFGRDLASARKLNACLERAFCESETYRIDHYLGKEAVENLLVLRFANTLLEPVWNRRYVSSCQITLAESFGIEGRGAFYEEVGALRDVVQNHLLEVLALACMEPPVGLGADALRNEKAKVFAAMPSLEPQDVIRGQYRGYRAEPGVNPNSDVETFLAAHFRVESWRWAGVPFLVRAGKRLAATASEVLVEFHSPPRLLFADPGSPAPHPNHLRFRLGPDEAVTLTLGARAPGDPLQTRPVDLRFDYSDTFGSEPRDAYERLLNDAIAGDARRFAGKDTVEEAWRVVDQVVARPGPLHLYEPGSWGPSEADALVGGVGWHAPA